jgi:hypothetical protein
LARNLGQPCAIFAGPRTAGAEKLGEELRAARGDEEDDDLVVGLGRLFRQDVPHGLGVGPHNR